MWPHWVTTVDPPSVTSSETCVCTHTDTHKLLGSLVSLQELPSSQWKAAEKGITSLLSFALALCLISHLSAVYWRFISSFIILSPSVTAATLNPQRNGATHTLNVCVSGGWATGDQQGIVRHGSYSYQQIPALSSNYFVWRYSDLKKKDNIYFVCVYWTAQWLVLFHHNLCSPPVCVYLLIPLPERGLCLCTSPVSARLIKTL